MWVAQLRDRLQRDMTTFAGVLRDGPGLDRAALAVAAVATAFAGSAAADAATADDALSSVGRDGASALSAVGRDGAELRTLLAVATAAVAAAAERHESRGCHHRLDFPEPRQPLERIVHFGPDRRVRVPAAAAAVSQRER